ncbi:flavin reductase family protein [Fundidesulfovibrio butyratiphilus]
MKISLGAIQAATPTPVWVVCAYDPQGQACGATVAWAGPCSSKPVCLAVSLRPERHTFEAILHSKAFTVNVPFQTQVVEADYFGMVTGKNTDKFAGAGLTAVKSDLVNAPYIAEFAVAVECKLFATHDLGAHMQLVGEIVDVKADKSVLDPDGKIDPAKTGAIVYSPNRQEYFGLGSSLGKAFGPGKTLIR